MKKAFFFLTLNFLIISCGKDEKNISQQNLLNESTAQIRSVGSIGDVKYSILPPNQFREENGTGWVLMDDKIQISGSDLADKYGVRAVPDGRGMFIRGLNLNRSDIYADPYKKEDLNHDDRNVGDIQKDTIKYHEHLMNYKLGKNDSWGGGWSSGANGQTAVNSPGGTPHFAEGFGGMETRPVNIALYTYIKINN